MEIKTIYNKVKEGLEYHLADSTAMLAVSTPIAAAMETFAVGMSDEVSINARLLNVGLCYAGIGGLIGRGRDLWRRSFKVTDKSSEKVQQITDVAYGVATQLVLLPPFYLAAGARDLKEIVIGTAVGIGLGAVMGAPIGYAIDYFRDLTGVKESQRLPKLLKKQNKNIKKSICALLLAGSIGVTVGVYSLTPKQENNYKSPEQKIEYISPEGNYNSIK